MTVTTAVFSLAVNRIFERVRRVVNSKAKGKAGELEFAALLRAHGYSARRGQQYSGVEGRDVVSSVPGVHFEVKRVEALNLAAAFDQATRDAAGQAWPVVAHRKSRQPWLVTLHAEHFLGLIAGLPDGIDASSK